MNKIINKSQESESNKFYAQAFDEIKSNLTDSGLYARCIVEADGNESRVSSLYIKYRAVELMKLAELRKSSIVNEASTQTSFFDKNDLKLTFLDFKNKYKVSDYNLTDATNEFKSSERCVELFNFCTVNSNNDSEIKRLYVFIRSIEMMKLNYTRAKPFFQN